ncbi:MAG: ribonuclease HI family protein [Dehalococcoidales bacterium]|nr:ribonuclease HI family protein [Dehalococcoidales bacterium]
MVLNIDGASRGNPGPSAIGVVIRDENRKVIARISRRIGEATNNQAEYTALIEGLKKALELGARRVEIFSDSELLVNQLQGKYKIKNTGIRLLYSEVVKLVGSLESFKISLIPREQNQEADFLANQALNHS